MLINRPNIYAEAPMEPIEMVDEFVEVFNVTHPPSVCDALIAEELAEVREAAEHLLKELADLSYVCLASAACGHLSDTFASEMEELAPLYAAFGGMFSGANKVAFRRVHRSNMSKLVDGKPLRRESDGKILKGPNYKPPYLGDLIPGVQSTLH